MVMGSQAAASGAAGTQAIKAMGVVISVEPRDFNAIVQKQDKPLVVHAKGGFLGGKNHYLTSYKGLAFFCKSKEKLSIGNDAELIEAGRIWVPGSI